MSNPIDPIKRFWAKVDTTGDCWLWTGALNDGYGRLLVDGKVIGVHRYSLVLVGRGPGAGEEVDHTCHNRACVRPDHLRTTTRKQNAENQLAHGRRNSKSGVRGVHWDKRDQRWLAQVTHHGRSYRKSLKTLDEAAEWVRLKRIELFTHNDADRVA